MKFFAACAAERDTMNEEFSTCAECGMRVIPGEYHPYTACVLYKHTRQAEKVQDMLRQVAEYGYRASEQGVSLVDALHNIAKVTK